MTNRTVDARLLEVVADIAYTAGLHRHYSGDSRADMQAYISWAAEFESGFTQEQEDDGEYMERVEKFAEDKLRAAGASVHDESPALRDLAQAVVSAWGSTAATESAVIALADYLEPDSEASVYRRRFKVEPAGENAFEISLRTLADANRDDGALCDWARAAGKGDSHAFGGGASPAVTLTRVS